MVFPPNDFATPEVVVNGYAAFHSAIRSYEADWTTRLRAGKMLLRPDNAMWPDATAVAVRWLRSILSAETSLRRTDSLKWAESP